MAANKYNVAPPSSTSNKPCWIYIFESHQHQQYSFKGDMVKIGIRLEIDLLYNLQVVVRNTFHILPTSVGAMIKPKTKFDVVIEHNLSKNRYYPSRYNVGKESSWNITSDSL